MSQEKLIDIWKMMKKYRFDVDGISNCDIVCTICKNILINAHNGPCGCRYCLDCITKYLSGQPNNCPGNIADCKETILNIDENIFPDQSMNIKISKTIVKCPENNCEFRDQLRNIETHQRMCESRGDSCPFYNFGCKESHILNADLKNHVDTEIVSHLKMLLESIDNMRNELELLKKDMFELKKVNENMRMETELRTKGRNFDEQAYDKLKAQYETEAKVVEELKDKINELEKREADEQKEAETKFDKISMINCDQKLTVDKLTKSVLKLESKICELEKNQAQDNDKGFEWCIKKWKEKKETAKAGTNTIIYSDSFYSHNNGYKMCLQIWPDGDAIGTHLRVAFCLLRGPFDDSLSWPFKYDVTFNLINQHTEQVHTSYTIKFDSTANNSSYQRPTIDRNDGIGYSKFISLNELSNNLGLCSNNRILIRCKVIIT